MRQDALAGWEVGTCDDLDQYPTRMGIWERDCLIRGGDSPGFDEASMVSSAGLVPALTESAGLRDLADEHLVVVSTDKARTLS
jgi:hypothetical protein